MVRNQMNKNYNPLTIFLTLLVLFCSVTFASAQKIVAKTKSGYTSSIEILGVVGDSLQFKVPDGTTKQIPLGDLSEDTLIRLVKEFAKLKVVQDSPAKPKSPEGNSPASGGLAGKEVNVAQIKAVPETLKGTIKISGAKLGSVDGKKLFYEKRLASYVWFSAFDSKNDYFLNFIIPKAKATELFSIDREKINLSGRLVIIPEDDNSDEDLFFEVNVLEVIE